jgi:predicted DNA-binding ribbon-helix-helix protein
VAKRSDVEAPVGYSRLINRNVTALRGRTSMRLEPELWEALGEICQRENVTLADLIKDIERHGHPGGRTSAVRVHVMKYFREAANEPGHVSAGHGALDALADDPPSPWRMAHPPLTAATI